MLGVRGHASSNTHSPVPTGEEVGLLCSLVLEGRGEWGGGCDTVATSDVSTCTWQDPAWWASRTWP